MTRQTGPGNTSTEKRSMSCIMSRVAVRIVACIACLGALECQGQVCAALTSGTISNASEYLQRASQATTPPECVREAVQRIASAPHDQAIRLLIQCLGVKRAPTEAEQHGIYIRRRAPDTQYPSIQSLYEIGPGAEPDLLQFLAQEREENSVKRSNAIYTLGIIQHDTLGLIQKLTRAAQTAGDVDDQTRLRAAAQEVVDKYCDAGMKTRCEELMK